MIRWRFVWRLILRLRAIEMSKTYMQEDLPSWCELGEQTENFVFVRMGGDPYPKHLEALLELGLACCGVSAAGWESVIIALRKE